MKNSLLKTTFGAALALVATTSLINAASIESVMKDAMKGEASLYKKVATGKASDAENAKLLEYVKSLPGEKPEKGDAASWKEKTEKLVKAVEDVVAKKPGATNELQTAGNCKACHNVHKPAK